MSVSGARGGDSLSGARNGGRAKRRRRRQQGETDGVRLHGVTCYAIDPAGARRLWTLSEEMLAEADWEGAEYPVHAESGGDQKWHTNARFHAHAFVMPPGSYGSAPSRRS
ncbi:hypothetical protein TNCT6_74610 [Streptomyces sp. 6-11-2]|nr:hypothetical protein TNCT6_74610 [Streptomyces sp. 6-11-2]